MLPTGAVPSHESGRGRGPTIQQHTRRVEHNMIDEQNLYIRVRAPKHHSSNDTDYDMTESSQHVNIEGCDIKLTPC